MTIRKFYDDGDVVLYHGDCIEPEAVAIWTAADVLCTDPPYGVSFVSNSSKYGSTKPIVGDGDTRVRDAVIDNWIARRGTAAPALVFGAWNIARPNGIKQRLIWDKGDSPGMGDLSMPWGKGDEEVYVLGTGFTGTRRTNVIRAQGYGAASHRRPNHPTPKPVALMEHLISYCPPGVIADPFAGSGATLLAARNLGRRAIGFEVDEEYCNITASRLSQMVFAFGEDEQHLDGTLG